MIDMVYLYAPGTFDPLTQWWTVRCAIPSKEAPPTRLEFIDPMGDIVAGFGPGWPTLQQEPPDLVEVPFTEAVELLLKHWSPSIQVMLETLKQKYGVVLARSPK